MVDFAGKGSIFKKGRRIKLSGPKVSVYRLSREIQLALQKEIERQLQERAKKLREEQEKEKARQLAIKKEQE